MVDVSPPLLIGRLGGEVKVTEKKMQIIFIPLMTLGNESPKEFLFGVLEDISQDLGFLYIIRMIFHGIWQKILTHKKICPNTLPAIQI